MYNYLRSGGKITYSIMIKVNFYLKELSLILHTPKLRIS